ncbi:hypothetical protein DICSQDRAFT_129313 [Dichomitus squalens LYAD-421 SS1]|uniref:Uncharacterized protein n=1 Tax=Dichomitus squalens (strain LYAD-421) TaxID=732165 RepID=R7SNW6_DICSQ|nr:uncharacterized protein DICSQDRAFT_129313 [Dichomitus squalens LYAD-421 SS1]EJF57776.1 hypothetical protein DICSQDRAFT_129313 [Dichomitus squalens LYAD-421 SS1]
MAGIIAWPAVILHCATSFGLPILFVSCAFILGLRQSTTSRTSTAKMAPVPTTPASSKNTTFWTPTVIVAVISILLLVFSAVGATAFLIHLRYRPRIRTRSNAQAQDIPEDVPEDKVQGEHAAHLDTNPSAIWSGLMPSTRSRPTSGSRPPEPEFPWPVLAVLPALRPKEPIHARLKKTMLWWEKDEVKHEPFTVADVMRAIEEVSGHTEGVPQPDSANKLEGASPAFYQDMPEIVVHPCDGTPSFSPAEDDSSLAITSASLPTNEIDVSDMSIATMPLTSPTDGSYSEPGTPLVATPLEESFSLPSVAFTKSLRVPIDSITAPHESIAVNFSNFSGQKFVLSAPPSTRFFPGRSKRSNVGPPIGLGLLSPRALGTTGLGLLPALKEISEDDETGSCEHPYSAFRSDSSVADLVPALEYIVTNTVKSVPSGSTHAQIVPSHSTSSSDISAVDASGCASQSSSYSRSTWDSNDPLSERLTRLVRAFATPTPPGGEESDEEAEQAFRDTSASEDGNSIECYANLDAWM